MRRKRPSSRSSTSIKMNRRSRARRQRADGARRRGLARLRHAYFSRAGQLVTRYSLKFDRLIAHLWAARHAPGGVLLRYIAHVEDLVIAVACVDSCGRAWNDLCEAHERTLIRRCRDCRDELEATVVVRRFLAEMRRDALSGRSRLVAYAGTRPLRTWLAEALHASRQRQRRSAFVLDPADSTCGMPFHFTPTGADG